MSAARVRLLGRACAEMGEREVEFGFDKRFQLLAYLAHKGDWVGRDELAYLFWPDVPDVSAKHSLRQLLKRLRKLDWLDGLGADAKRMQWPVATDVKSFGAAFDSGHFQEALNHYRGPFLEGMRGRGSPEFEDWLDTVRHKIQLKWREAVLACAAELEARQEYGAAANLHKKLLETDSLDEDALRSFMRALHLAGKREQAVRAYEGFARQLAQELDMKPTAATEQLARSIREARPIAHPKAGRARVEVLPKPAVTPAPASPLIGREVELAEIAHLLSQPHCRLVTLTGPGGVGKSRVALQVVDDHKSRYADGAHFVALEALTAPEAIPLAIASELGLTIKGETEAILQVSRQLAGKELLLALDNFEHLIGAATMLSHLLAVCPRLDLVVTSRERLAINEEWVLAIHGLPYPDDDSVSPEDALGYDALRLLVHHARRLQPRFDLAGTDITEAIAVCRLVAGLPLGIELAAVWTRVLPLKDIAQEIRNNLDFLASTSRNQVPRHQSILAAFEHSWKLLTAAEQDALRKLSVFTGGFCREAASFVADVPMAVLAGLLDKSLLRLMHSGRFDRHPLLYRYTQEKLAQQREQERVAQERHAKYFVLLAEEAEAGLGSSEQLRWLKTLDDELENLRAALKWTRNSRRSEMGMRLAAALASYWQLRGMHDEARSELTWLFDNSPPSASAAYGKALNAAALIAWQQGDAEVAQGLAEQALAVGGASKDERVTAAAHSMLGMIAHYSRGDRALARTRYEAALQSAHDGGSKAHMARALHLLGILLHDLGDNESARRHFARALELCRALGDKLGCAKALNSLATVLYSQGDGTSARPLYEESLQFYKELGDRAGIGTVLGNLGNIAANAGNYDAAQQLHEESLSVRRELGEPWGIAHALKDLAGDAYRNGDYILAQTLHEQSLEIRRKLGDKWRTSDSLRHLGDALYAQGKVGDALSIFQESLALRREIGYKWGIAHSLRPLAMIHIELGETNAARDMLAESMSLSRDLGDEKSVILTVEGLAELALAQGQPLECIKLWSAADKWRSARAMERTGAEKRRRAKSLRRAKAAQPPELAKRAVAKGLALTLDSAAARIAPQPLRGDPHETLPEGRAT